MTKTCRVFPLHLLRAVVYICAAASAFCFFEYLLSVFSHPGTVFSYGLAVLTVTVVVVPPFTEHFWEKKLPRKLFAAARGLYSFAVCFFTVTFAMLFVTLYTYDDTEVPSGHTVVLVYGCRTDGTQPGEMLQERLDTALDLLHENPAASVIVSGDVDDGAVYTEAQVMAWYLAEHGIAAERIFLDEEARDTKGNIRGFLRVMEENGLTGRACISVSSDFHMPRIAFLCGKYGLDSAFVGAPTARMQILFPSVVREYMAYVKMVILNTYR